MCREKPLGYKDMAAKNEPTERQFAQARELCFGQSRIGDAGAGEHAPGMGNIKKMLF